MRFLAGSMPWVQGLPPFQVTAACTLAATLSVARSPASAVRGCGGSDAARAGRVRLHCRCLPAFCARPATAPPPPCLLPPLLPQIAVLKELEGKGTYCSLVMAVVVAKDVLLFAAFAINVELAAAVGSRSARGGGAPIWLLLQPAGAILASVALGGAAGWALSKLLRLRHGGGGAGLTPHAHAHHPHSPSAPGSLPRGPGPLARLLRHPTAARLRPALPWLVSGTAFAAAEALRAEPLLTCVAAGLVASNWR